MLMILPCGAFLRGWAGVRPLFFGGGVTDGFATPSGEA